VDIGLITAFLGGALAILSPCGALLLPAFFAATVGSGPRLLLHGVVFFAGLLVVLVPLGIGVGVLGAAFAVHRTLIIAIASVMLIVFGVLQIFGIGFDPARLVPGAGGLQRQAAARAGYVKTFLLGAVSGIAGFCAGPILGAVLTVAATQGSPAMAGVLLGVYGAGMVVPLLIIAAFWGRINARTLRALRGRPFTMLGREFHSTSVITGVLIVIVGVLFYGTNGLVGLPELLPTEVSTWLQTQSSSLANPIIDIVGILLITALGLLWWWRAQSARARRQHRSQPPSERHP
jgi:cytochrome c biogenesis protein CcdA